MTNMPHDVDAEQSVLASCMHSPAAVQDATGILVGADFYSAGNEAVWDAIASLHADGAPVDPITVRERMLSQGQSTWATTLPAILAAYVHAGATRHHALVVREKATRRAIIAAATRATQLAYGEEAVPEDLAATAAAEMEAAVRKIRDAEPTLGDQVAEALDAIEDSATAGWNWPWADLRHVLIPPTPGQFILIAARPAVGKSVSIVDVARHVAIHSGLPVVLHTLEMSATEVLHRMIAAEARVPLSHIKENTLTEAEWQRVSTATQAILAAPLHIKDDPSAGLPEVRASIRQHKPVVVLFDYFQLGKTNPATTDRRQAIEELSRGFKILAKTEGVPIVAAAQLNRKATERSDRKPMMSDLRETGGLEQDADTVVLLHREDADEPESPRAGEVDLIIAKQRNGPTGTITLAHQLHYSRFVDMAA